MKRALPGQEFELNESVQNLTTAIASGDAQAFARFYRAWFDRAYGHAKRATGRDEAFCLDVVQDAMMRVIRSMRAMETEKEIGNWFRAVVTHCAYDRLRKEKRDRIREMGAAAGRPAQDDELNERLAWLHSELARMDPKVFPLIALRFRFGWTLQRMGQVLKLKPGAVDGRIRRVTEQLRKKWSEPDDD